MSAGGRRQSTGTGRSSSGPHSPTTRARRNGVSTRPGTAESRPAEPVLHLPPSATPDTGRLPRYVEHGGELVNRHPADALDARLYGFAIPASRKLLDAYCERLFNRPSGNALHWRAASSDVLVNFVDIPTMGSTELLDQHLGTCEEREAAIWFPVFEERTGQAAWAIPYMFVDSAIAMAGGREVYGFPKQLGRIQVPRRGAAPARLSIETPTLRTFSPTSRVANHRLLTVTHPGPVAELRSDWSDAGTAFSRVDLARRRAARHVPPDRRTTASGAVGTPGGAGAMGEAGAMDGAVAMGGAGLGEGDTEESEWLADLRFFAQLAAETLPVLLLKQFRDANVQSGACYQAVVLVETTVSQFRSGGLLQPGYTLEVERLAGEPLGRELGIAASSVAHAAFWLDFDFVVPLAEILWEADVGGR